jgi:magnesium transporter
MSEVSASMFRNGKLVEHGGLDTSMPPTGASEFVWIQVQDPTDGEFAVLQERFKLHNLAVEDAMTPAHMAKVDLYDDQVFVVLKTARLEDDEIRYHEVEAFLSERHIITVQHGEDRDFNEGWGGIRLGLTMKQSKPDFILHAIMDYVVDRYFPVLQMIEDEVLAMEQRILDGFLEREGVTRLFRLRREAIHFQHVLSRMHDVCGKLMNLDIPCIGADAKPYFRDVFGHLTRLDLMIGSLVDVIRAVFEASNLLEQQRQGIITRQLAAWAAILGVPTAIAGIYGMNFRMPELEMPHGYFVVMAVMLTLCAGLYLRFRRLRWL